MTKTIRASKCNYMNFSSNNLFSFDEVDGIELNGGNDDFGDEVLRRLPCGRLAVEQGG